MLFKIHVAPWRLTDDCLGAQDVKGRERLHAHDTLSSESNIPYTNQGNFLLYNKSKNKSINKKSII